MRSIKLSFGWFFALAILPLAVAAPLRPGDPFPLMAATTLTNRSVSLPHALAGKPGVVILTFTKAAGGDARMWNESLSRDFPETAPRFTVMILESVPRLFRGVILSGIRVGMPAALQERTLMLLKDEALWKARLGVQDADRAYLVLLDAEGRIRWLSPSAFAPAAYTEIKSDIATLPGPR